MRSAADGGGGRHISPAYERYLAERSSLQHLLDLKRAGHSPRFTELVIPADCVMPSRLRQSTVDGMSSSAGMCESEGFHWTRGRGAS
jgi:hypothetical protein